MKRETMDSIEKERRLLQKVVALAALIPIAVGGYGILYGAALTGDNVSFATQSHIRFLSGLFFAIGIGFLSTLPRIEMKTNRFRFLSTLVFVGGLARLVGFQFSGLSSILILVGMAYELIATPALCLWQGRIAKRIKNGPT